MLDLRGENLKRQESGATVGELACVLGMAAVLSAAALPSFSSSLSGLHLRSASVQLGSAMLRARAGAIANGASWQLRVLDSHRYTVGPVDGEAPPETLPGGVRFESANSGGEVRFSPSGTAENATFVLAVGSSQRRVILNQRGKVTCE